MSDTFLVCEKCGKPKEYGQAKRDGWLIKQRIGQPQGWLIIRCPEHITDYARRAAGIKQQYYHQHKQTK